MAIDSNQSRGPDDRHAVPQIQLQWFPGAAGVLAAVTGGMVLLGWALNWETFKRILPGLVAMNPMTATTFILAGLALWFLRNGSGSPEVSPSKPSTHLLERRVGRMLAGLVLLIGAVKIAGIVSGWDSGIDQLLFREKLNDGITPSPNRMAPNVAGCFVLAGLALLLLDLEFGNGHRPSRYLSGAVGFISLLGLIGYAYQVKPLYGIAAFIPTALHTASTLFLLCLGIFCLNPGKGIMAIVTSNSSGGMLLRKLLPSMVLVIIGLGWLRLEGERQGLYSSEMGVALYTISFISIFSCSIVWIAKSLHRSAMARREARQQVEALNVDLKRRAGELEAALRENHLIMEHSLDVICTIDEQGRFVFVSAACEKLWGYKPEELIGRPYIDLVLPEDHPKTNQAAAQVMAGDPVTSFENCYRRKDGSFIPVVWSASWSPADKIMFCVAHDMTERKKSEEILRQNEERTRSIINTAYDAFIAIDTAGLVRTWNTQAEITFGWLQSEVIGRRLSEILLPPSTARRTSAV